MHIYSIIDTSFIKFIEVLDLDKFKPKSERCMISYCTYMYFDSSSKTNGKIFAASQGNQFEVYIGTPGEFLRLPETSQATQIVVCNDLQILIELL